MQLAKDATSTIPIVFFSGEPVEAGLVASLARPGGNLTGVSDMNVELLPKRFELLSELAPQARVMGLLVYSNSPSAERIISEVQAAARAKGVEILILKVSSEIEIDAAFETLVQRQAGALLIGPDAFFFIRRDRLALTGASLPHAVGTNPGFPHDSRMSAFHVRRDKAALSSGCEAHPALRSSRKQPGQAWR